MIHFRLPPIAFEARVPRIVEAGPVAPLWDGAGLGEDPEAAPSGEQAASRGTAAVPSIRVRRGKARLVESVIGPICVNGG